MKIQNFVQICSGYERWDLVVDYMKQGKLDETNVIFETVSSLEDAVQVQQSISQVVSCPVSAEWTQCCVV